MEKYLSIIFFLDLFHKACYCLFKNVKPSGAQTRKYHFTTAEAFCLQAEVMFCLAINLVIIIHTEVRGLEMFDILHFLGFISYKINLKKVISSFFHFLPDVCNMVLLNHFCVYKFRKLLYMYLFKREEVKLFP